MSDAGGTAGDGSPDGSKSTASKDRSCPYCGQAFTSSSLGRHLDLYIKEKNPKPADGIHDVDAIRKLRGGITRRQPRGSLARRDTSTPGTPTGSIARKSPGPESVLNSSIPKEGQFVVDKTPLIFHHGWEATGVMNDIPVTNGAWNGTEEQDQSRGPSVQQSQSQSQQQQQRAPSRAVQRQQLDTRQRLTDAVDTARAAELALRELLSSWRAAKQQIDMNSLPFDFDPLSLDFPALTLQCLQAPPTLFSSTPHPTSSSWSVQPPAQKQFEALKTHFNDEFRKWKIKCASATTASAEDLTYPPQFTNVPQDVRENIKKAEKAAAVLESQVAEHLLSTYQVWDQLSSQRKNELWSLELARSVGRRQKEVEKLKETHQSIKQENENLKSHVDQLNRLQQPREFRIMPPATIPFDQAMVLYASELGVKGARGIGLNMDDRHVDLTTLVSRAIERWKNVIVSSRPPGMSTQRPLDPSASTPTPTPTSATANPAMAQMHAQPKATPQQQGQQRHMPPKPNGLSADSRSVTTATTNSVANATSNENSDEDADAEMEEDDSFAPVSASIGNPIVPAKLPQQQQQLKVPRTRGHAQQATSVNDASFLLNGAGNAGGGGGNRAISLNRPMANLNAATGVTHGRNPRGHNAMSNGDYSTVQGVGGGDPMYMD